MFGLHVAGSTDTKYVVYKRNNIDFVDVLRNLMFHGLFLREEGLFSEQEHVFLKVCSESLVIIKPTSFLEVHAHTVRMYTNLLP